MIKVNLANYREDERKARRNRFYLLLVIAIILAILFNLVLYFYYQVLDLRQTARNQFLQEQIANIEEQLSGVDTFNFMLKDYKSRLDQYNKIINLTSDTINLLQNLNIITPVQIYYQQINFNNGVLKLHGVAKNSLYLSSFVDNLNKKYTKVKLSNSVLASNNSLNFDILAQESSVLEDSPNDKK